MHEIFPGGRRLPGTILFFVLLVAVSACGESTPEDPRAALFRADQKALSETQFSGIKPLSTKLGAFFVRTAVEDFGPDEWRIFTRKKSKRLLVLIKVPKLRKSVKGSRLVLLSAADKYLRGLGHRENYIAMQGRIFLGAAKTPTYEAKGFPVTTSKFYSFYGPPPKPADPAKNKKDGKKKK